ncbi:MAG: S9 family peptidase [Maricaulaceae bacterium]
MIPRALLFGAPERFQGRISPDGSRISWLAPIGGALNLWTAPASAPDKARALTRIDGSGVLSHQWTADSARILYVADPADEGQARPFVIDVATGAERALLADLPDTADSYIAHVSADRPDEALLAHNGRDRDVFDLYRIDLSTLEIQRAARNPGFFEWVIDNDLEPRFGLTRTEDGGALLHIAEADDWLPVFRLPPEDVLNSRAVGFDATNTTLFYLDSEGRDKAALISVDLPTGEQRVLAQVDEADLKSVVLHPATRRPVAVSWSHKRKAWRGLEPEVERDFAALREQLSGDLTFLAATQDFSTWVLYEDDPLSPGAYWLFDRGARTVSKFFDVRPGLADAELADTEPVVIPARDGLKLVSYLTRPPEAQRTDGWIILLHPGPWARFEYGYSPEAQWLANRGYSVLSLNYRGSTGFGKAFLNAGDGEWTDAVLEDVIDARAWLIDQGLAAEDAVAVSGRGWGGFLALSAMAHAPEAFTCAAAMDGFVDLVAFLSADAPARQFDQSLFRRRIGDLDSPQDYGRMVGRSPSFRAEAFRRPVFIAHAGAGPLAQADAVAAFTEALSSNATPVVEVLAQELSSLTQDPEVAIVAVAALEEFLAGCLGGRYEPAGSEARKTSLVLRKGEAVVPAFAAALAPDAPSSSLGSCESPS